METNIEKVQKRLVGEKTVVMKNKIAKTRTVMFEKE